jgi:hypothetical protein
MPSSIGVCDPFFFCPLVTLHSCCAGRELATGRKIAIKKIKVGQFKDGLDMSAVREVKYLRELHHPNVIEVGLRPYIASSPLSTQRIV